MRSAKQEGYQLVQKFIRDHTLPLYTCRPQWCTSIRTGKEEFAGIAQYKSQCLAASMHGNHNAFLRMRFGRLACQPEALRFLEATFTEVGTYGGSQIGTLDHCPVKELALALRNFVENEALPTPLTSDDFCPNLHVTVQKPEHL